MAALFTRKEDKVVIELPVAEASNLSSWLRRLDTGWLNDQEYLEFNKFLATLSEVTKNV